VNMECRHETFRFANVIHLIVKCQEGASEKGLSKERRAISMKQPSADLMMIFSTVRGSSISEVRGSRRRYSNDDSQGP
jgi:hypothetical protein